MTQATVSQATTPPAAVQSPSTESGSSWGVVRIAKWVTAGILAVIIIIFLIGLALALFTDATQTAGKIQVVRDIVVIIISIEGILIVVGIAVLIVQIARLVNLVKTETKPILDDAAATAKIAKGTAGFVGDNVAEPIIKTGGFFAGLGIFLRELGGIRRALRRNHREEKHGEKA